jgi:hypothetical protein
VGPTAFLFLCAFLPPTPPHPPHPPTLVSPASLQLEAAARELETEPVSGRFERNDLSC